MSLLTSRSNWDLHRVLRVSDALGIWKQQVRCGFIRRISLRLRSLKFDEIRGGARRSSLMLFDFCSRFYLARWAMSRGINFHGGPARKQVRKRFHNRVASRSWSQRSFSEARSWKYHKLLCSKQQLDASYHITRRREGNSKSKFNRLSLLNRSSIASAMLRRSKQPGPFKGSFSIFFGRYNIRVG